MPFQTEYEYLIHLLNCAIHDKTPEDVPESISLQTVFEIGKYHEVANIAYLAIFKIADKVPAELMILWRGFYYNAIKRDQTQCRARTEILSALHQHGIDTLEVQGTVVKQYYPQSHLRMMSDLDFIIPKDRLDEAQRIMQDLGYQAKITHENTEVAAAKDNLHIELHTEYFDKTHIVYAALNHPFSQTTLHDDHTAAVTDTVYYLFHWLHTLKHATEFAGIGIRRIIDLYYLEAALKDKVDLAYIDGILSEYALYEIKTKLIAVKDHWFCGIEPDTDISALEAEILASGTHGTREIYFRNKFTREQANGIHFVKLRYVLGFVFPKKQALYAAYPFCAAHRLPLVICWICRWSLSVFRPEKRNHVKQLFSDIRVKF